MPNVLLVILLIGFMGATLFALIRGIVIFLKTTEADLRAGPDGPSVSSQRQNKAMFQRIGFQAAAVLVVVIILLFNRPG